MKTEKNKLMKLINFISAKKYGIVVFLNTLLTPSLVYANEAEQKWTTLTDSYIVPWVKRLGGVVLFIGAIEFALGWQRNDPDARITGLRTVIAGAIVLAVGYGSSAFLS